MAQRDRLGAASICQFVRRERKLLKNASQLVIERKTAPTINIRAVDAYYYPYC